MAERKDPNLEIDSQSGQGFLLRLSGDWCLGQPLAWRPREILGSAESHLIAFDTSQLGRWDSLLLNFLFKLLKEAKSRNVEVDQAGLPAGVNRLLALANAVPEKETHRLKEAGPFFHQVGVTALGFMESTRQLFTFIGESVVAMGRLASRRAQFQRSDLVYIIQDCGAQALPIVSLISFLVGLILAFVGAIQLQQFGAAIYVADLVAIAMAREMAAIMTGIIMAGRTGAAFAAQLGTMNVNEEIDALRTLGISPMEFLVLPRMLALAIMIPLLCIYADLVGMLGGLVVGIGMLDLSLTQYVLQTQQALDLTNIAIGIVKGFVFGILVALAGCMRGMQCGRSASAVGQATTSAVVTAIVAIIATDAIFAYVTHVMRI